VTGRLRKWECRRDGGVRPPLTSPGAVARRYGWRPARGRIFERSASADLL
jgi:hypothetical protein